MTGEPFPRFDLYGELEVSPLASVGAIEAAYRSLVKRHHPDVAGSPDDERMKRLNLARDWLTDPIRRSRYDADRARVTVSAMMRPRDGGTVAFGPEGEAPAPSFGVNAAQVRNFLGELRGLDAYRARQVWDGRAVAHAKGYTLAQRAADSIGRSKRHDEWLFAREAASVIARGELGDSVLTEQVLDVVADAAGAIAIRDLLSAQSFDALLLPWRWRGKPVAGSVPFPPIAPEPEARPSAVLPPSQGATPAPPPVMPDPAPPAPATEPAPLPVAATAPPIAPVVEATPPPIAAVMEAAAPPVAAAQPSTPPTPPDSAVPLSDSTPATIPPFSPTPAAERVASPSSWGPGRPGGAPFILTGQGAPGSRPLRPAITGYAESKALPPPTRRRTGTPLLWPALASVVALGVIWGLIGLLKPPSDQAVAGITDAPGTLAAAETVEPPSTDPTGGSSEPFATDPGSSVSGGVTGPTPTPRVVQPPGPVPTPPPGPGRTPRPTPHPTPPPGPTPTPGPTPPPTPTPAPTPTPPPGMCQVVSLINVNSANAQVAWNTAGFSGTVVFSPIIPPQWKIQAQSLVVGAIVPCTSGITVYKVAP